MEGKKAFYITTTLPYVNADPHVGFAMEIIRADVVARYKRLQGYDVFFNTGTDEHGAKIFEAAQKEEISVQAYVDKFAARFRELKDSLNLSVDKFVRTTDLAHIAAAQEFWRRCEQAGDIYKKPYKAKYCIGCELEKTDSELVNGRCPIHPDRELEIREEENYFFKWSKYQEPLLRFYERHSDFVIPDFRFNETKAFVKRGLEDFSISRLKEKMPWGVPVPGDEAHVMYVWFDALVNYISTLGWPGDEANFGKFWKSGTPIQYCGKDNNRQQTAMWQAMLMSAELPNTSHVVIDGFINGAGGVKMSKSLGNVISPFDVIELFKPVTPFPEDVLRFVLLHDIPSFEDGDLTIESIKTSYTAHLANGLGNLVSRVMTLSEKYLDSTADVHPIINDHHFNEAIEKFDLHEAINLIWFQIGALDIFIQEKKPFSLVKNDLGQGKELIRETVIRLTTLLPLLRPFLPRTTQEIEALIHMNKKPETPLFARLS